MSLENSNGKKWIEVCFSPALLNLHDANENIVVVIDILRATSSICVAFQHGAERLVPVSTVEETLAYRKKGYLIGGERNGEMLPGFDFGNSPFSFMDPKIKGSSIALTTTNGTRAIRASNGAYRVAVGSFLNLDVLVSWLKEQNRNIVCLCAGWKNSFNIEDTLFAGALVYKLKKEFELSVNRDSAITAEYLYLLARNDMFGFLAESSHRLRLKKLKIEEDIAFCLTPNQTEVVPVLNGDTLYNVHILQT